MNHPITKSEMETIDNKVAEEIEFRIKIPRSYLALIELYTNDEWEMLKKANNSNNIPLMLDTLKMIIEEFEGGK